MHPKILIALALAAAAGPVAAAKLYKWVDERGVVHYADRPPAGQGFEEIEIKERKAAEQEDQQQTAPAQSPTEAAPAGDRISAEEARRRNCDASRSVLAQLQANERVRMDTDGDGQLEELTPAQRRAQIALYRERVATYCQS